LRAASAFENIMSPQLDPATQRTSSETRQEINNSAETGAVIAAHLFAAALAVRALCWLFAHQSDSGVRYPYVVDLRFARDARCRAPFRKWRLEARTRPEA
jgi:hypothetical protein